MRSSDASALYLTMTRAPVLAGAAATVCASGVRNDSGASIATAAKVRDRIGWRIEGFSGGDADRKKTARGPVDQDGRLRSSRWAASKFAASARRRCSAASQAAAEPQRSASACHCRLVAAR